MFQSILNTLFSCSHQRTTFPLTPSRRSCYQAPGASAHGTYVVCLDCGKEFSYNWDQMRVGVTLPNKTGRLAPVAEGTLDGLPPRVA